MINSLRYVTLRLHHFFLPLLLPLLIYATAYAGPRPESFWNVDEVRTGMKGQGRTVMKGTKIESFEAEVLGVMKNTSPGRDMILCRLSGLGLEKTGIIAGMSGSPIHIDGKLLGAVAFAWAYGKEPIAGVTPFCQMHCFAAPFERRDLAERTKTNRVGLRTPIKIDGRLYENVNVSNSFDDPASTNDADGLWMLPLRTPLAASGFSSQSLHLLKDQCKLAGLVPVQGGAASAIVSDQERNTPLEPGGPLALSMITGDFDLSGIGTVTHIEGKRVYGWGHPFMSLGACDFPLMTGYIHTIYPRQSVSFKMGSPLRAVGIINADTSTGIAGWLERKPDMIPVKMTVCCSADESKRTFNVQIARQNSVLPALVFASLTNSVDMGGDLPEELTAEMETTIEVEGHAPIVLKDTYSGASYSGGRAPPAIYNAVSLILGMLTHNSFEPIRVNRITSETHIRPGRISAEIEAVELDAETYSPGDTIKATVFLRPFKGDRQSLPISLTMPGDMPEGPATTLVVDDLSSARMDIRENPVLGNPRNLDQLFETIQTQTAAKRTKLVMRIPLSQTGVAVDGKSFPSLPGSMVQMLAGSKRTGAQTIHSSSVAKQATPWVVQGAETVRFNVVKNKRVSGE